MSTGQVRPAAQLTEDEFARLVAQGVSRMVAKHGIQRVAVAAGCSTKTIQRLTAGGVRHCSPVTLSNLEAFDNTALTEMRAAYGLRIAPAHADAANDLEIAAQLSDGAAELVRAAADGKRIHTETLRVADKIRPLLPALTAIVREADALRGAA